jgi:hypothetical protein
MKKIVLILVLLLLPSIAFAQCNGIFPTSNVCGTTATGPGLPGPLPLSSFALGPAGVTGDIQENNGSGGLQALHAPGTSSTYLNGAGAYIVPPGTINSTTSVTGASTTYTNAQNGVLIERANSGSAMIDTLPGTSPGILSAGVFITIKNNDSGGVLAINVGPGANLKAAVAPTGWVYICPNQSISFYSDGTNYWALGQPALCVLQAGTTFFVAGTGTASTNHGLTSAAPLLPTQAYQLAQSILDANSKTVTFSGSDTAYSSPIQFIGPIIGQGKTFAQGGVYPVVLLGNNATPGLTHWVVNVTGNSYGAIQVINGADVLIEGWTTITSGGGNGIYVENANASVEFINCGNTTVNCLGATRLAYVQIVGAMSYSGVNSGGILESNSWISYETTATMTMVGGPVFSSCFACAQYPGSIIVDFVPTFSGSTGASSVRYSAFLNGNINTGGGGANFFPGTSAGTTSTGGQYN